jgi:hypothetical protein
VRRLQRGGAAVGAEVGARPQLSDLTISERPGGMPNVVKRHWLLVRYPSLPLLGLSFSAKCDIFGQGND